MFFFNYANNHNRIRVLTTKGKRVKKTVNQNLIMPKKQINLICASSAA